MDSLPGLESEEDSLIEGIGFAAIGFATVGCFARSLFVVGCLSSWSRRTSIDFSICSFHRQQVDRCRGLVLFPVSFRRDHSLPVRLRDCPFARPLLPRIEFRRWAIRPDRSQMIWRRFRH